MKRYKLLNIIAVLLLVSTLSAQAQEERNQGIIWSYLHGWEYGIKAGFSIGGTSPLPLVASPFQLKETQLNGLTRNGE